MTTSSSASPGSTTCPPFASISGRGQQQRGRGSEPAAWVARGGVSRPTHISHPQKRAQPSAAPTQAPVRGHLTRYSRRASQRLPAADVEQLVRAIASNAEERSTGDSQPAGSAAASQSVSTPATPVLPSPADREVEEAPGDGDTWGRGAAARGVGSQPRGSGSGGVRVGPAFPRNSITPAPRRGMRGVADVVARPGQGVHHLHAGAKRCWSQPGSGGQRVEPASQGPTTFSFAALHTSRSPAPRPGAHSGFHGVGSLLRGGARSPPRARGGPPPCTARPGGATQDAVKGGDASESDVEEEEVEEEGRGGYGGSSAHPVGVDSVLAGASQGRAGLSRGNSSQNDPVWLSGLVRRVATVARHRDEEAKACSPSAVPTPPLSQPPGHTRGAVSAVGRRVEAAIRAMHHAGWMLSREGEPEAGRPEGVCLRLLARQGPNRLLCRVYSAQPSDAVQEGSVVLCCVHAEAASAVLRTAMLGAVLRVQKPWTHVPLGPGGGPSLLLGVHQLEEVEGAGADPVRPQVQAALRELGSALGSAGRAPAASAAAGGVPQPEGAGGLGRRQGPPLRGLLRAAAASSSLIDLGVAVGPCAVVRAWFPSLGAPGSVLLRASQDVCILLSSVSCHSPAQIAPGAWVTVPSAAVVHRCSTSALVGRGPGSVRGAALDGAVGPGHAPLVAPHCRGQVTVAHVEACGEAGEMPFLGDAPAESRLAAESEGGIGVRLGALSLQQALTSPGGGAQRCNVLVQVVGVSLPALRRDCHVLWVRDPSCEAGAPVALAVAASGVPGYWAAADRDRPDAALLLVDGAVCHDQCLYADEWSTFHAVRAAEEREGGAGAGAEAEAALAWEAAHGAVAGRARFTAEPAQVAPSLLDQALAWARDESWEAGGGHMCERRRVRWGPGSRQRGWAGPLAVLRGEAVECAGSAYDGEDAEPCLPLRCHVCEAVTRPANAAIEDGEGGETNGAFRSAALMPTVFTGEDVERGAVEHVCSRCGAVSRGEVLVQPVLVLEAGSDQEFAHCALAPRRQADAEDVRMYKGRGVEVLCEADEPSGRSGAVASGPAQWVAVRRETVG